MTMGQTAREPVLVDLALQGGGSHGAFTWGVLDRLIEEPWLRIDAISGTSGSALQILRNAGLQLISGSAHLYFVFVLMQFYLLFPVLLWLLNRTRRWPAAILVVSLGVQVWVSFGLHYQHWNPQVWYDINSTREVTSYVFYLVAGMVIGAHLPAAQAWAWRRRRVLLVAGVLVLAGVEAWYGLAVRSGQAPASAADPFEPEAIPLYAASILHIGGNNCPANEDLKSALGALKLSSMWSSFAPNGNLTFSADMEILDRGPSPANPEYDPPFRAASDLKFTFNFSGPTVTPS